MDIQKNKEEQEKPPYEEEGIYCECAKCTIRLIECACNALEEEDE